MTNDLIVFGGESNVDFTQKVCRSLNIPIGNVFHHQFPSGEMYCQYKDNIRGKDVFLIQSGGNSANNHLMQLLVMSDAARRSSADRITAVLPMSFYSRQDRKDKSRVPISAKLVFDLIQTAGFDRILTMDLHSAQIGGFTNMPVDILTFEPVLVNYIKSKFNTKEIVIVAPDIGAAKRAEKYSKILKCGVALIIKNRIDDTEVEVQNFVGDVKGKTAIIIDDLTESCGTLIQAAVECWSRGATKVVCAVSHLCITDVGKTRLDVAMRTGEPLINEFIHSNTVKYPFDDYDPSRMTMLDMGEYFAKAITCIHENKSISELFL